MVLWENHLIILFRYLILLLKCENILFDSYNKMNSNSNYYFWSCVQMIWDKAIASNPQHFSE